MGGAFRRATRASSSSDRPAGDARERARCAGGSKYHLDMVCFGQAPGWTWAGLGYVGGAGAWLRNSFSTGVAAHELGHNFGLNHANFWDTSEESVIGPGSSIEYGDKFDTMGSAAAGQKHFNARYKNYLNWMPAGEVAAASTNGLYRIFPQDVTNAVGPRALKIVKNSRTNYWVEFRQKYTSNKWLMSGAGLRWAGNGNEHSNLLDTSPGSAAGKDDAAILLGRTFSDTQTGIHVTVVGKGGTAPESLEVFVNRGSFPMNLPPLLVLTASAAAVVPGAPVEFNTAASDPNGDALVFAWDFGDGNFTNGPAATYEWSAAGHYLVRCTATDMKGGTASDSVLIRVGSPTTFLLSGRVTAEGQPLEEVRVYVSSAQVAFTDSQGDFTLTGLAAGSYTVNARRQGYAFIHPGFTNPVRVGPNASQIDFEAVPQEGQDTVPLIVAGTVWQYLDDGSNQGTLWKELNYDASAWKEGPAQLGYGDQDVSTVVSYGLDPDKKYITTYFRHSFTVTDPSALAAVSLGLVRDDGAVVYLNGREVFRSNMPGGTIAHTTRASSVVAGTDESTFFETSVEPGWLRPGTNVVAVEVHQANAASSDLSFDFRLTGVAASISPAPRLSWSMAATSLKLSWDLSAVGWKLYASSAMGVTTNLWLPVPAPMETNGGLAVMTLPLPVTNQFYRLQKP